MTKDIQIRPGCSTSAKCGRWLALGVVVSVCGLGWRAPATAAGILYRTVALKGDAAPGTAAGVVFETFDSANLNAAGSVVFTATLSGPGVDATNLLALWSEGGGALGLVARQGSQAPGTEAGVVFDFIDHPIIDDSGGAACLASLTGPGVDFTNNLGLWSSGVGGLTLVARTGSQAPGTPAGTAFSFFDNSVVLLNAAGQTGFRGILTGVGVNPTNDRGIWSQASGTLDLVIRSGDPAPGTPAGTFFLFLLDSPVFNDLGQAAFSASLTGAGVTPADNSGIWSQGGGALALVARAGDPAPGTEMGVSFDGLLNVPLAINNAGQTVFRGKLVGPGIDASNDTGIWLQDAGSLTLVSRGGDPAMPGVAFVGFGPPVLNGAGRTAFTATLTGAGVDSTNDAGVWSKEVGILNLVARKGDPAPGTAAGVNFSSFTDPALNGAGHVALLAGLTGFRVDATNDVGLWAQDPTGALRLVAREGDPLEVAPGDLRTVSALSLLGGSGGQDGRPRGLNDAHQVAFVASFTDGACGSFVATLCLAADVNADGMVDTGDIERFVAVLLDPASSTLPERCAADMNADATLDGGDVALFLGALLP